MNLTNKISIGALIAFFGIFSWVSDKLNNRFEKIENETVENKIVDKEQSIYIEQMQDNQKDIQENQLELIKALERLK